MSRSELERVFRNADLDGAKKRAAAKSRGEADWKRGEFKCPFHRGDLRREWEKGFRSAALFHGDRERRLETALEVALSWVRTKAPDVVVEGRITRALGH